MADTPAFELALAKFIRNEEGLDYLPQILGTDFEPGGDVQISDMTWDHDNATFEIVYRRPDKRNRNYGTRFSYRVDIENDFAEFLAKLLEQ